MAKVKILRILNRFNIGGPVYNALYLTKFLDKVKYDTFLIGGMCEPHEQSAKLLLNNQGIVFKQLNYMRRSFSLFYDIISLIEVIKLIYQYRPDIIHTHAAKAGFIGRLASFFYFREVKVVHTFHGNVFQGYFSKIKTKFILFIERFLAKKTDKIIAISELQKNDLVLKFLISDEKKIQIIPLGFDLKIFSEISEAKRKLNREIFKIENSTVLITIIGRVVPIKNHKFFIDVFNYCRNRTNTKIKALVVGDGDEINNVINHAKKYNLKISYKKITDDYDILFTSWRSDIDNILSATDISCLTSISEGTPVSIIESMASGTVCISSDVGGVSDLIDNGINGLICNLDVNQFGKKLIKLIDNKLFRDKLSKYGQTDSLKYYNYNVLTKNMDNLYSSIIR